MSVVRYLKFEISGMTCAIPLSIAREVLPFAELMRPPKLPEIVEGFLKLGAESLTVLRLDRMLSLNVRNPSIDSHLLLLRSKPVPLILLVDRVLDVISVQEADLLPLLDYQSMNGCVTAQINWSGEIIQVLAIDRLTVAHAHQVAA